VAGLGRVPGLSGSNNRKKKRTHLLFFLHIVCEKKGPLVAAMQRCRLSSSLGDGTGVRGHCMVKESNPKKAGVQKSQAWPKNIPRKTISGSNPIR